MALRIRRMTEDDLDMLYRLLSDGNVMEYLEKPYTKEKTAEFLDHAGLQDPPLIYAAEKDGIFIGYVIYHAYDETSAETGWVLFPEYWGHGFVSELTEMLIDKAFSSGKDAVIECVPSQKITRHIALKYGFIYEGADHARDIYRLKNHL